MKIKSKGVIISEYRIIRINQNNIIEIRVAE